jgi:hypothetical protein
MKEKDAVGRATVKDIDALLKPADIDKVARDWAYCLSRALGAPEGAPRLAISSKYANIELVKNFTRRPA